MKQITLFLALLCLLPGKAKAQDTNTGPVEQLFLEQPPLPSISQTLIPTQ